MTILLSPLPERFSSTDVDESRGIRREGRKRDGTVHFNVELVGSLAATRSIPSLRKRMFSSTASGSSPGTRLASYLTREALVASTVTRLRSIRP